MKDLGFLLAKNKEVVYLLRAKEVIYIGGGFLEGIIIYRATENLEKVWSRIFQKPISSDKS